MGTGQLSQDLNGEKLQLSVVELGTTSGTGSLYFTLELKFYNIQGPQLSSLAWLKCCSRKLACLNVVLAADLVSNTFMIL